MHFRFFFALLLLLCAVSCEKEEEEELPEYKAVCDGPSGNLKKVLFIGLDGCRTDALLAANTPAIDSLTANGSYHYSVDRGIHTVSVPGWTTLLHGVFPEKHGCENNSFDGCNYEAYPDVFHYIRAAKPELRLFALTNWDNFLKITTEEDYAMALDSDSALKEQALEALRTCNPDALLLHFDNPDAAGHDFGFHPDTVEYLRAIEQDDRYIAAIMQKIKNREQVYGEEWLTIVCTDHGGEGTRHGGQDDLPQTRFVFLIASASGIPQGEIQDSVSNVDVVPTIFKHLEIPINSTWGLDGKALF